MHTQYQVYLDVIVDIFRLQIREETGVPLAEQFPEPVMLNRPWHRTNGMIVVYSRTESATDTARVARS